MLLLNLASSAGYLFEKGDRMRYNQLSFQQRPLFLTVRLAHAQHLPDLHLAYIDMREGGSKVAPATSTPPVQPALSKSTSSSSSLLGGAFMARSSSTPVIAHNRSSADHQRGAPGFGRDASKQSSSTQQGVDMIFTGGEVNGSVGRESERCNVREAEKVMVAGPLCHLPASGVPPWPVQDPWVGSTHYALDA
eukprot:scaffold122263_cov26-Tisochrysis_lutea.AAC.1